MKFAFSTSVFRLRPLAEAIEGISKAGFCAIELIADRPHAYPEDLTAAQITALNQSLEQKKMKVVNLDSCAIAVLGDRLHPSWLEEDWKLRETRIRYTLDCMRLAAAMGIPHVTTQAGGQIPDTMTRFEADRLLVANMHRMLPLARKLGVKLLIEPEPEMLIETSDQALKLHNELGSPENLGVDFNVGHFFCAGEDPCEAWKKLKPIVAHVHLEDIPEDRTHRHALLGEGVLDISGFLGCLQESGYNGWVTVKLDSFEKRADETALASAHYLQGKGFSIGRGEPCA